mmetsp:Transcript_55409/g.134561  ORF Transcript_55409/g.134561 Transcript_55409/m.134561 type:complete len:293 (+) Transcript_55409:125-1003(+)
MKLLLLPLVVAMCNGLSTPNEPATTSRRNVLQQIVFGGASAAFVATTTNPSQPANAVDVDDFLKTGMVAMPIGVGGQAAKSKPITGVLLREGTDVSRDNKSGAVVAEILLKGKSTDEYMPVLASFSSPWPLATGPNYDVECRDMNTADGAFLAVTPSLPADKSIADVKDSFFVDTLFSETGRFSFYGTPTDIKVKKSKISEDGLYRILDVTFSTLSQATSAEIPRNARIVSTVPSGSKQAVMLIGSASASRWKKGSDKSVATTIDSFRAVPAPASNLKIRVKDPKAMTYEYE